MSNTSCRVLQAAAFLAVALGAACAAASTPAAWTAHDKAVAASCTKASGLKNARVAGEPLVFDDRVGMTALLVSGRYPQPHMKNRSASVLCLYDRKKRQATVTPADSLRWVTPAPTRK